MGEFVSPEVTVAPEHLAALVALVGLVVRVCQQMCLQVGSLVKAALADGALVGRLLHVQDLVNSQGPGLAESFATLSTHKWLLFRVDVSVISEMILSPKRLTTDVT